MQHFDFKIFRALGRPYSGITFFDDELDFGERIMYAVDTGGVLELPNILEIFDRGQEPIQMLFTAMMALNVSHLNPVCLKNIFSCTYRKLAPITLDRAELVTVNGLGCYIVKMSDGGGVARLQHDKIASIVAYAKYEGISDDIASGNLDKQVTISDRLRRRGLQIKNKWRCELVAKCLVLSSSHIGDNPRAAAFKTQEVFETTNMLRNAGIHIPGVDHVSYTLVAEYTHPNGRVQKVKIRKESDYVGRLKRSNGFKQSKKLFNEIVKVLKIKNDYFNVKVYTSKISTRLVNFQKTQDSDWAAYFEPEPIFTYTSAIDWWLFDDVVTLWYMKNTVWNTTCSRNRAHELCNDMLKFISELQHFLVNNKYYDPLRSRHSVSRRQTHSNNIRDGDYFNKEFEYVVTDLNGLDLDDATIRSRFKVPAYDGPLRDPVLPDFQPKYTYKNVSSWKIM
jgi:hypothetical protein